MHLISIRELIYTSNVSRRRIVFPVCCYDIWLLRCGRLQIPDHVLTTLAQASTYLNQVGDTAATNQRSELITRAPSSS